MKDLVNTLISDYLIWVLIILFAASLGFGLLINLKKLRSDDKTVKDEGIEGMLYTTFGFFIVIFLLGFLLTRLVNVMEGWGV
ncbi:MAG: hypothetical protein AAF688_14025 [Bacteroidota bacterium]